MKIKRDIIKRRGKDKKKKLQKMNEGNSIDKENNSERKIDKKVE